MIDLPGLGKSQGIEGRITPLKLAEWVKEYMDQSQIDKAFLIGHSLGGAILLAFAIYYPDRVYKLILLDEGHKPFPRIPKSEFGSFAYAFPLLSVCVQLFGKYFLNRLAPFFMQDNEQGKDDFAVNVKEFCDRVAIEENEYIRIAMKNPGEFSENGLKLMFGYYNLNLPSMLKKIKVPTHLIYATFETIHETEYKRTGKYIQKFKDSNLPIEYSSVNSGHYVHWSSVFPWKDLKKSLSD